MLVRCFESCSRTMEWESRAQAASAPGDLGESLELEDSTRKSSGLSLPIGHNLFTLETRVIQRQGQFRTLSANLGF